MYSVLSPEGFASILWKDSSRSDEAAKVMKLTPDDLFSLDVIDKIIKETRRKVARKSDDVMLELKQELSAKLKELKQLTPAELVEQRQKRFRNY